MDASFLIDKAEHAMETGKTELAEAYVAIAQARIDLEAASRPRAVEAMLERLEPLLTRFLTPHEATDSSLTGWTLATLPETDAGLVELLADAVHVGWMDGKRANSVTSRKAESGEELMVPYAMLSEAAKDLDRSAVRTVLAAIEQSGYSLVRRL